MKKAVRDAVIVLFLGGVVYILSLNVREGNIKTIRSKIEETQESIDSSNVVIDSLQKSFELAKDQDEYKVKTLLDKNKKLKEQINEDYNKDLEAYYSLDDIKRVDFFKSWTTLTERQDSDRDNGPDR